EVLVPLDGDARFLQDALHGGHLVHSGAAALDQGHFQGHVSLLGNDECRIPNDERMTNDEVLAGINTLRVSSFVIGYSAFFRHSTFVITGLRSAVPSSSSSSRCRPGPASDRDRLRASAARTPRCARPRRAGRCAPAAAPPSGPRRWGSPAPCRRCPAR